MSCISPLRFVFFLFLTTALLLTINHPLYASPTAGLPETGCAQSDIGCDGICYSGKKYDECNVCGGSGPGECSCDLSIEKDDCGICGGHNEAKGCDEICFSGTELDDCGVCGGNNKDKDCNGDCFGEKYLMNVVFVMGLVPTCAAAPLMTHHALQQHQHRHPLRHRHLQQRPLLH